MTSNDNLPMDYLRGVGVVVVGTVQSLAVGEGVQILVVEPMVVQHQLKNNTQNNMLLNQV